VVPSAKSLHITDLVISENAGPSLLETARRQGYQLYVETTIVHANAAARSGVTRGVSGLILDGGEAPAPATANVLQKLRASYPKLTFLVLDGNGKQPQMRGQSVVNKQGILQVSSPTAQPWVDSNLARVRFDQVRRPAQPPLYSFEWAFVDPAQQQQGPDAADYELAIAEAGAFKADLVLDLHEKLQQALAENNNSAWAMWNEVNRYIEFYSRGPEGGLQPLANIGVIADNSDAAHEPVNLMARHNIPFVLLHPADLKADTLRKLAMLVLFVNPSPAQAQTMISFASRGGVVVIVNVRGSYPWHSGKPAERTEHALTYSAGRGRIVELLEPVTDPEAFAQDIRRLMNPTQLLISLWNALTTVAVPYRAGANGETVVELVNYAQEPLQVQVRIKGDFPSAKYETPEHGCCESLKARELDGFTEVVVPSLRIAGRVQLQPAKNLQ
jgi:hypothetical protein